MEQPWRFLPGPGNLHPAARDQQFSFRGGGFPLDGLARHPTDAPPVYRPAPFVPPFVERPHMHSPMLPHYQPAMAPRRMESWDGYSVTERERFPQPFPSARHELPEHALYMQNLPKRMRIGEEVPGYSVFHQPREDERRLNLVRNHGRTQLNVPLGVEVWPEGHYLPGFSPPERPPWTGVDQGYRDPDTAKNVHHGSVMNNPPLPNNRNHASRESSYGIYADPARNVNAQDSARFFHSEVNQIEKKHQGGSTAQASTSDEVSAVNSQQRTAQSPSFVTPQGPRRILDHHQQVQQAGNVQNPSISILGRYNHGEGDVQRSAERKYDAHIDEQRNTQHFYHRPAFHDGRLKPLEVNDHRLSSQSSVLADQCGTDMLAPTQSLPSQRFHSRSSQALLDGPAGLDPHLSNGQVEDASAGFAFERRQFPTQALPQQHPLGNEAVPTKHVLKDKRTIIDASHIFCKSHRASRPDYIAVILRGLPGSGKSYLARALRDVEVDNGGSAPRIHCIDDYFMSEIETVEDGEASKSSVSVKGKKQVSEKIEYCYEPEMEEAYRSSMLKAFKKTVEDRIFSFAIVDDRNLRVADFAQFWAIGKRSGYEVYLLEAPYKDPAGCAARNIHGFTSESIKRMAEKWEEAPPFYLQLDIQALFRGDDLGGSNIQEVDMDMEDAPHEARVTPGVNDGQSPSVESQPLTGDAEEESLGREDAVEGARELGKSKWSADVDEDVDEKKTAGAVLQPDSLSGLIKAYGRRVKSVRWGDQAEKRGFSIGISTKRSASSLVIGPGPGYNLESNPQAGEEVSGEEEKRKKSLFLDHIRAERESFRAVFDRRRRQRIGGLNDADDE